MDSVGNRPETPELCRTAHEETLVQCAALRALIVDSKGKPLSSCRPPHLPPRGVEGLEVLPALQVL